VDGGIDIASTAPAAEAPAPALAPQLPKVTAPQRGHHAKIAAVIAALDHRGMLPPHLRTCVRDARVIEELKRQGYGGDQPSRQAIARAFSKLAAQRA
jgi:hypothetical protein